MTRDEKPDGRERSQTRVLVTGGVSILLLAVGWFVLSHFVMHTAVPDAIGEALGVAFALLVVASFLGAVLSSQGRHG
jgi:hypothetical protein